MLEEVEGSRDFDESIGVGAFVDACVELSPYEGVLRLSRS